jgi:hypothetical protein
MAKLDSDGHNEGQATPEPVVHNSLVGFWCGYRGPDDTFAGWGGERRPPNCKGCSAMVERRKRESDERRRAGEEEMARRYASADGGSDDGCKQRKGPENDDDPAGPPRTA